MMLLLLWLALIVFILWPQPISFALWAATALWYFATREEKKEVGDDE